MVAVVVLVVIGCVLMATAWVAYQPHLPAVTLNSVGVSNFSLFKSELKGKGNINVTLRNPSKRTDLKLENFKSMVMYGKTVLAKAPMADLYLRKNGERVATAEFRFEGKDGISGCDEVLKDRGWKMKTDNNNNNNGDVRLEVKMLISTKFVAENWWSTRRSTWVRCQVELSPASHGLGVGKLIDDCIVDFSINSS